MVFSLKVHVLSREGVPVQCTLSNGHIYKCMKGKNFKQQIQIITPQLIQVKIPNRTLQ